MSPEEGEWMPKNVYSEIHLHFVWHTKRSRFFIKTETERMVHDIIRKRASEDGIAVHAVGGTSNHIHLAVTIPPTIEPSSWIGQVKGGSSHDINQQIPSMGGVFGWQTGYGVVSFGAKAMPWVVGYIQNQKKHHDQETWEERLEQITRQSN